MSHVLQEIRQMLNGDEKRRQHSMEACEDIVNQFKDSDRCRVSIDYVKRRCVVHARNSLGHDVYLVCLEVSNGGDVRVMGCGVDAVTVKDISKFDISNFVYRCCKATVIRP